MENIPFIDESEGNLQTRESVIVYLYMIQLNICNYIYIYIHTYICLSHFMVDACYPGPISCGKSLALPTNGPVRSA